MRFACQSCGKAYNLPEERIADKSNVKLKCRVCGAIVEVKKQGELVAQVLDDAEAKLMARVSEAPAPLTSMSPEEDDPDGATVSISEASINDHGGPLELELPVLPPAAATGFAALAATASMGRDAGGGARLESVNVAPPLPPPPLSPSSLPPPPAMRTIETSVEALSNGSNGATNGAGGNDAGFFPEEEVAGVAAQELVPPVAPIAAVSSNAMGISDLSDLPASPSEAVRRDPTLKLKMAAAFVTGVLIDRIVAGLFN